MLRWDPRAVAHPVLDAVLLAVIVTQFGFANWVGMVLLVVPDGTGRHATRSGRRAANDPEDATLDGTGEAADERTARRRFC